MAAAAQQRRRRLRQQLLPIRPGGNVSDHLIPNVPQNRIVVPDPNVQGIVLRPAFGWDLQQIRYLMAHTHVGVIRGFVFRLADIDNDFGILSRFMLPEQRAILQFGNGESIPFNDWNRNRIMGTVKYFYDLGLRGVLPNNIISMPGVSGVAYTLGNTLHNHPDITFHSAIYDQRILNQLTYGRLGLRQDPGFRNRPINVSGLNPITRRIMARRFGSFFAYTYILPLPSRQLYTTWKDRYGLFTATHIAKGITDDIPCIYRALDVQGLPAKKLEKLRTLITRPNIPQNCLGIIARRLDIHIRLRTYTHGRSKDGCRTFDYNKSKTRKQYNIGLIANHYFSNDKRTGVTQYGLNTFAETGEGGKTFTKRSNGHGDTRKATFPENAISSFLLIKFLIDHSELCLRPIQKTKAMLNNMHARVIAPNEFRTLEYDRNHDVQPYGVYPCRRTTTSRGEKHQRRKHNDTKEEKRRDDSHHQQEEETETQDNEERIVIAADFETTTDGAEHLPYLCCYGSVYEDDCGVIYTQVGLDCARQMVTDCLDRYLPYKNKKELKALQKRNIVLQFIFHNASYDIRFLFAEFRHLTHKEHAKLRKTVGKHYNGLQLLESGTQVKSCMGFVADKKGHLWKCRVIDSYAFIPNKLSMFPGMFGITDEKKNVADKEVMPYHVYTRDTIFGDNGTKRFIRYEDFVMALYKHVEERDVNRQYSVNVQKSHSQSDRHRINKSIVDGIITKLRTKWNGCVFTDVTDNIRKIDLIAYAKMYCERDVYILIRGWLKFSVLCKKEFKLDINRMISINQASHVFLKNEGAFTGCTWMSGVPRAYVQNCVEGGKCMMRHNKKVQIRNQAIVDFDACSLYPSAIRYMGGYLKGYPKIIPSSMIGEDRVYASTSELPSGWDGYFMRVKIRSIATKLPFPILSYYDRHTNVRQYSDGKDILNIPIYVSRFQLEDACEFHDGVTFSILDGYYYDDGRENKVASLIQRLYDLRKKYKQEKNPLQFTFKLFMNSSYGRTILKPIDTDSRFLHANDYERFMQNNYDRIVSVTKLNKPTHGNKEQAFMYRVKLKKDINEHYSGPIFGVDILAFAKRIMNRVMVTAHRIQAPIYYQDTDSMHIRIADLKRLEVEYNTRYGAVMPPLVGKELGQFHSDFDMHDLFTGESVKLQPGQEICSDFTIIVGKKAYLDRLYVRNADGTRDRTKQHIHAYHVRLKGVPYTSIMDHCIKNQMPLELVYQTFFEGEKPLTFNLLAGGSVKFFYDASMTKVQSMRAFQRRILFPNNKN